MEGGEGDHRRQAAGKANGQVEPWDCIRGGSTERPAIPRAGPEARISMMLQVMEAAGQDILWECWVWLIHQRQGWDRGGRGRGWAFPRRECMEL